MKTRRFFSILLILWVVMVVVALLANHLIVYSILFVFVFFLLLYIAFMSERLKFDLETKNRELQDLIAAKDKFISVIAHDLKTPAANIETLSKTLKDQFDELGKDEQRIGIDMLVESAKIHNELLNTLLDMSRLQSGSKHFNPERIGTRTLADEVLEQTKLQAQQKQIGQTNQADEYFVHADKRMTATVIRNLVVNAIKFTHSGGKIVIRSEKKGTEVIISVADTGIGIADSKKDLIFSTDTNKSTSGTANETGTGLGLLLCKEFVEHNGGRIWFESEQNKGTTFFFTLPSVEN